MHKVATVHQSCSNIIKYATLQPSTGSAEDVWYKARGKRLAGEGRRFITKNKYIYFASCPAFEQSSNYFNSHETGKHFILDKPNLHSKQLITMNQRASLMLESVSHSVSLGCKPLILFE